MKKHIFLLKNSSHLSYLLCLRYLKPQLFIFISLFFLTACDKHGNLIKLKPREPDSRVHTPPTEIETNPQVTQLEDDPNLTQSKTWTWSCSKPNCTYRFEINQIPDYNFPEITEDQTDVYTTANEASISEGSGVYWLHVEAKDMEGLISEEVRSVSVILDNTSFPIGQNYFAVISPNRNNRPSVAVNGIPPEETLEFYTDSSCTESITHQKAESIYTLQALSADGSYDYYVETTDAINNTSDCTLAFTYVLDTTPPVVAISTDNDEGSRQTKTWNWACDNNEACFYLYTINQEENYDFPEENTNYNTINEASIDEGNGTYWLHVKARDIAGNSSDVVSVSVNLDNSPPNPPTRASFRVTAFSNNPVPVITALGFEPGSLVQIYRNRVCMELAQVGNVLIPPEQTSATFSVEDLTADGSYNYYATVTDPAGNMSDCSSAPVITYVLDRANPIVTNIEDDSNPTRTKTWTWDCSKPNCTYRFAITQEEIHVFPEDADYNNTNEASVNAGNGTYWLHVEAKDAIGNVSRDIQSVFTILDNQGPEITGIGHDTAPQRTKTWTWGCSEDNCTYRYEINQNVNYTFSESTASYTTNNEATVNEGNGTYWLHVEARDPLGNLSTLSVSVALDNTPPESLTPEAVTMPDLNRVNEPALVISDILPNNTVQVYTNDQCLGEPMGTATVIEGQTSVRIDLETLTDDGSYDYYVRVLDVARNPTSCVRVFTYVLDRQGPEIIGLQNDNTSQRTKAWTWDCDEDDCTYRYEINQNADYTFPEPTNDTIYTTNNEATLNTGDGTYWLHIEARDTLGNLSRLSVSALLDNTLPVLSDSANFNFNSPSNTRRPTVTVFGLSFGDTLEFYRNSECSGGFTGRGVMTSDASGTSITMQENLTEDGSHTYYIVLIDRAGNRSRDCYPAFTYILDTDPPNVTGLTEDNAAKKEVAWNWTCDDPQGCRYNYIVTQDENYSFPEAEEAFNDLETTMISDGNGMYYVYVRAMDRAGNISETVRGSALLDNMPPEVLEASSVTINFNEADRTSLMEVSDVEAGHIIEFFNDANCRNLVGSGQASSEDTVTAVSLDQIPNVTGTYSYYTRVTDVAGNPSLCSTDAVVYDFKALPPDSPTDLQAVPTEPTNPNPIVIVEGVRPGYQVGVYTDPLCTQEVGSVVVEEDSNGSVEIAVDLLSPEDWSGDVINYSLYANTKDVAGTSECSTANASYTLQKTQTPNSLNLAYPGLRSELEPSLYASPNPVISVSGIGVGQTIELYNTPDCSGIALGSVISSSDSVDVQVTASFYLGTHRFYAKALHGTNISDCSQASDFEYTLYRPHTIGINNDCLLSDMGLAKCGGDDRFRQLGLPGNPGIMSRFYSDFLPLTDALPSIDLGCRNQTGLTTTDSSQCSEDEQYWAKAIMPGGRHTCSILDTDDSKCWGDNISGQLGIPSHLISVLGSPPQQVIDFGCKIELQDDSSCPENERYRVQSIGLGEAHTVFLFYNGQVKGLGSNSHGQIDLDQNTLSIDNPLHQGWFDLGEGRKGVGLIAFDNTTIVVLDNGEQKCSGEEC